MISDRKTSKTSNIFVCDLCDFVADRNSKYVAHINTKKHKYNTNTTNTTIYAVTDGKKFQKTEYICECGKSYNYNASLFNHKKKCQTFIQKKNEKNIEQNNEIVSTNDNLIQTLMQDNKDFKNMLMDLIPKIGNNNTITNTNTMNNINNANNNVNSNNVKNKFNINVFLNEQCKDAMSMNEFIESIEISMQDLLLTKEQGFASGISNIFLKGISKLSPHQRPIHCTDIKRETLYIKNEKWEKDSNQEQIKDAIKSVSAKQFKNIKKYKEAKPNCMTNEKERDEYLNIIKNTTEKIDGNDTKIIKDICNNVYINKNGVDAIE